MRALALLFAFAAISACATPAPANAQSALDPIAACLANAEPDTRRECIGIVTGPCIEEPGGETTAGSMLCHLRERDLWRAQVGTLTEQLRVRESTLQVQHLNAMLAAHEPWMQARCSYSALYFEGGSLARVVAAACLRTTTAELAINLLERGDEG